MCYFVVVCDAGEKRISSNNTCMKCPLGYYQPKRGENDCIKCGDGQTTEQVGTDTMTDCIRELKILLSNGSFLYWKKKYLKHYLEVVQIIGENFMICIQERRRWVLNYICTRLNQCLQFLIYHKQTLCLQIFKISYFDEHCSSLIKTCKLLQFVILRTIQIS